MRSAAFTTADLCDAHGDKVRVLGLPWHDFGGRVAFFGSISTVLAFEDNSRVREAVAEPGKGRVLLIAGGGSLRRSLLGDLLAQLAVTTGWAGVVIDGALRDSAVIATLDLGVKALGTCPRKTDKRDQGLRDVPVEIGGVLVHPGEWLYADGDGVVVCEAALIA